MKKAIILGAMAFFAINLATIQNANAQVNKQREQMLQSANDTSGTSDQAKIKTKKIQKLNAVNNRREQMLQAANEANELNEQAQPDLIIVNMEDIINKLGVNQDSTYRNKMMTTEPGKTLKKKKILIKPKKESEIDQIEQTEKHP